LPNDAHYFALGIATAALFARGNGMKIPVDAWLGYGVAFVGCMAVIALRGALPRLLVPIGWTVVVAAQLRPTGILMPISGFLGSWPMQWLGNVSYSLYLIHFPILLVMAKIWSPQGGSVLLHWAWLIVAFAASLLASVAMQAWIETRCNSAGHLAAKSLVRVRSSV
jgi:peptidoglycan/LPS O-acetylase OafA/YrhL